MIQFDRRVCSDFAQATSREWLEANGLGGFASSTIIGCNTRRYHGLLIAALNPPVGRTLLLSKLEEELVIDGITYPLSTNQYPGAIHPQGYRFQEGFRLEPFPIFCYQTGGLTLEKEVFMPQGLNAVVITYRLRDPVGNVRLRIRPFVAGRDFHHLLRQGVVSSEVQAEEGKILVRFGWGAELHLYHNGAFSAKPEWFRNFEYAREMERGLDAHEDLYSPGVLDFSIGGGDCWVVASAQPVAPQSERWREKELARRQALMRIWPGEREEIGLLLRAADTFLVHRPQGLRDVIAGYPWFGAWGRDAMISLPGLCLVRGDLEAARGILLTYAKSCQQGLLPNHFAEADGKPEYNSVDAALWFVNAVGLLSTYPGQETFISQHLLPAAGEIVQHYAAGTRYGIRADADGLLTIGAEGGQLTWMDAKVGGRPVTPRSGKPVEIQALWYNALRILQHFGRERWGDMAERAETAFPALFWNEEEKCLYDCIGPQGADPSIRPNQILAASLPYPILPEELGRQMLEVVERELLTPYGLRTLSPRDRRYHGRYEGDLRARDEAYHQGSVWPWLMGPFLSAYLRLHGHTTEAQARAREMLEPLFAHLSEAGLGTISEVFDGDPPHHPRGCISQAWSVAELLRVWASLRSQPRAL